MKHRFLGPTLASLCLLGSFASAIAATRTVTNINDSGAGSLRTALTAAANGDAIVFSNSTAGGTVNFYDGTQRIITLSSALPNLSTDLSITGPGPSLVTVRRNTVAGTPAFRIFFISNGTATGPTVSISGLTIGNGNLTGTSIPASSGAGILSDRGNLTLSNVAVTGNTSTQRDGGGIYSYGRSGTATLRISDSVVSGNSAVWAGGIYSDGYQGTANLLVRNTTISGNIASELAGGVLSVGVGGSASANVLTAP